MIFQTEQELFNFIASHQKPCDWILKARKDAAELSALIDGCEFDSLITKIEGIESEDKMKARKKYSRSIEDYFERLLLPIANIFNSTGFTKKYNVNPDKLDTFLKTISNIRDGKSIQSYVQNQWMPVYHTDPNGIIFIEYTTIPELKVYPTYKNICNIRYYELKSQVLDVLLFEPCIEDDVIKWRVVDDKFDYTVYQKGESFVIDTENTFEHPFGEVPAFVNSDILSPKKEYRISPIKKVVPLSKEYARDQSVKTIYKFLHGFPTHWRYVSQCRKCTGLGKTNEGKCTDCDGNGYYKRRDVTDMVTLPVPDKDSVKLAPDIAGYISPDLNTWSQYDKELETLEIKAQDTHWGTHVEKSQNETATGRYIDVQPVINKLNKYADIAEWVEWKITEWVANAVFPNKNKSESIALIVYGRRYIIDSPDTLLQRYEDAKYKGENSIVLDRLFNEYITAKYSSDPEWLGIELLKAKLEPYLHLNIMDVNTLFGRKEAFRKQYFQQWWSVNESTISGKSYENLKSNFETDFKQELATTFAIQTI